MEFAMRRSRVLEKLRAGEVVYSFKVNSSDPRITEIGARYGFDCVWTGMEHVANDLSVVEHLVYAAKAYDVDLLCRVSRGGYSDYVRPLELDAAGIMVPHVMSADDARNVVRMTRFHPVGRRPIDGGNADGFYCNVPSDDYLRQANEQRFVILQIEDPESMNELDEIAAVEGYDMLFFGPGDFSQGIGAPGRIDHPRVQEGFRLVAEAAQRHGKFAGTMSAPAGRQKLIDMGYRFLNVGADVIGVGRYCADLARDCGIETPNNPAGRYG